jgi:thymidylate synthase
MTFEEQYLEIVKKCLNEGIDKPSRGGVDQRSIFGVQMKVNLQEGFPILTVRKLSFKIIAHELLWILGGHSNLKFLHENGIHIWDKFADENGETGRIYQWRNWEYLGKKIDQLSNVIEEIKENPMSKRLVVSSWNVGELDQMSLPPCPHMFQFMVAGDTLHCNLSQRAGDLLLGVPYDLALYALLTSLVAQVTNLKPGTIYYNIADCHIYHNHLDMVREMSESKPAPMPKLVLDKTIKNIDEFKYEDMKLEDYNPITTFTGEIAVGPLFQAFFHDRYKKVKKPKPDDSLKINSPYFTEIDWSVNRVSQDIKDGLLLLSDIQNPIVSFFGSHRLAPGTEYYEHANKLANLLGKKDFAIMTGGGPGIMRAANLGAKTAGASSIGLRSDALMDKEPGDDNALTHQVIVHFLFSRRFIMSIKSRALIFYPGAYGTLSELFEDLALMSANLVDKVPVICVGSSYWSGLINWFQEEVIKNNLAEDPQKYIDLIQIEDDLDKIVSIICEKNR